MCACVCLAAAVGTDDVVVEPATGISFRPSLLVPDSSIQLSFLGAGTPSPLGK